MENAVNCKLLWYADDSALLESGKDVNRIETILSNELQNASHWLVDNKLSLHLGKPNLFYLVPKLNYVNHRNKMYSAMALILDPKQQ